MDEQTPTETILDEAIASYPLAETPPNFTYRVMAEVQNTPQTTPTPAAFRLNYLDFLIPGFLVLFFLLVTAVFISFVNIEIDLRNLGALLALGVGRTAVLLVAIFFEVCLGVIAYFYLWSDHY